MTVSEIRDLMLEKVIPESLLPQNIAVCLMDENAAPPELDAFTFLNRLRSLGIGSADFLYLLKGCGAPSDAISRIEEHPDMNLQALIVTLESSGLAPKDYTRMLYTARQLWEHTITMRINSGELEAAAASNEVHYSADMLVEPEPEDEHSGEAETAEEPEKPEKPVRTARQKKRRTVQTDELDESSDNTAPAVSDEPVKPVEPNEPSEPSKPSEPSESDETDELIKPVMFTARQKKRTIDDLAEELGVAAEIEDKPDEKYTARQRKRRKSEEESPDENAVRPEAVEDSPTARRNAVIVAAAGAAVLFALGPALDVLGFRAADSSGANLHFAADSAAVFSEIYTAYSNGRISSEYTQKLSENEQVFGDMLISSGEQLGVFSSGSTLWTAEPDSIGVYSLDSGVLTVEVLPPDGAEFVRVVQTASGVTAVYSSGAECGLMGLDGSGEAWRSGQCGTLTDIFCGVDVIRLGSVYTPGFTRSFTVDDTLEYLPWTLKNGTASEFSPAEIAVTGSSDGCSYAVWAEYSAESGEQLKQLAALGAPVYSGAEFFAAAMHRETGSVLIAMDSGELTSATLPEITACAAGNGIIADAESSDSGVTVYLRGSDLKPLGAFTTGGGVDQLRVSGNIVYVGSEGSTVMAVDISDPAAPKALDLTSAEGAVNGEYALCGAVSKTGITLTLYKLDNGSAVQADSFAKALTASELESFRFSGVNCTVINGTECSGAAYRYFDGVSVVDEFAELGRSRSLHTLYDDRTGYTAAAYADGALTLINGDSLIK